MKSGEILATVILDASLSQTCAIPRAAKIGATSFHRVGSDETSERHGVRPPVFSIGLTPKNRGADAAPLGNLFLCVA